MINNYQPISRRSCSGTTIQCLLTLLCATAIWATPCRAQDPVRFYHQGRTINVTISGRLFTNFLFPDTLPKPVLFPVIGADGAVVTRGFPLDPRPGDPTDHPHHIGIWLNFENVNGFDFWNNSYAIPADKKDHYGSISTDSVVRTADGKKGLLEYHANWKDPAGNTLLEETTSLTFSGSGGMRRIDRKTTLTAKQPVTFKDAKDGLLGFRVAKELQLPQGDYLNSEGQRGDSAWSKRARWCRLSAPLNGNVTSIVMLDHPSNPGYPAYWHARGYGLFAVNPLGASVFSNGKDNLNLALKTGEQVTFTYTILVVTGKEPMAADAIDRIARKLD
ncbi:PmoA family protein [Flavihumibacter petaseus]|uniref:Methane oxygenase PmoA n=1 Tax=Flavihumibacter petaseus NBRC 106054 TaxID=1220578 RepID=A0A0E9N4Q7_9BACT|nr:PmoA family protein [Flavihumibacter petaseus]GAO44656.1 hypothetical protein FPE01S_03_06950 [Flavihumibacter petaseus NBRC 106054]